MKLQKVICMVATIALVSINVLSINNFNKAKAYDSTTTTKRVCIEAQSEKIIPSTKIAILPIKEKETIKTIDPYYGFTEEEVYILAQLLCGSKNIAGDGEYDIDFAKEINYGEVCKVLCVVMNRVRSDIYPDTVTEVICQKRQFSVMPNNLKTEPSDIALETVKDWCNAYDRHDKGAICIPINHLYFTGDGFTNTTRAEY